MYQLMLFDILSGAQVGFHMPAYTEILGKYEKPLPCSESKNEVIAMSISSLLREHLNQVPRLKSIQLTMFVSWLSYHDSNLLGGKVSANYPVVPSFASYYDK